MKRIGQVGCGCLLLGIVCCVAILAVVQQSEFTPPTANYQYYETPGAGGNSQAAAVAFGATTLTPTPVPWVNSHGWRISSEYGWRTTARGWPWFEFHSGMDLAGPQFAIGNPVFPLQDGRIFDIRYMPDRYSGGGLCVEMLNYVSFEEGRTFFGYCHLAPYNIQGHVYDADTGKGIENAVVYILSYPQVPGEQPFVAGPSECGACDEDGDGRPDFEMTTRQGREVIVTDASGYYCYDYATPDGGHIAAVEYPAGWEPDSPTRVGFEIRVDGTYGYDVGVDFYGRRPPEPTPTPTPPPTTVGPGSAPEPTAAPGNQGVQAHDIGPRYTVGQGPPLLLGTDCYQGQTILGRIGRTGYETGPHLHLFVQREGIRGNFLSRINKYLYDPPRCTEEEEQLYPWACADGYVKRQFLAVGGSGYMTHNINPAEFLPLANAEFGVVYMDKPMYLPPPGNPEGGAGSWWSPGDLFSDGGGGRLRGFAAWRWFDWIKGAFCGACACCTPGE